ncbi:MAG: YicC family protein [Deltaproteobacteria bacterium]|nr:YicC family protein [Candidatus Anaeroferrophillus wilburensis]MBN2888672.1 YicC family protein [Deltaproteobacteria bacterium]
MVHDLLSMTGYGESRAEIGPYAVEVTVRSVNSRYLDFRFKAPSMCSHLEPLVRRKVQQRLLRGKVDLNLQVSVAPDAGEQAVQVNRGLAKAYKELFETLQHDLALQDGDIPLSLIVGQRDVLQTMPDPALMRSHTDAYLAAVEQALEMMVAMQTAEGEALKVELLGRCQLLEGLIGEVTECVKTLPAILRDRLVGRITELLDGVGLVDENRIYQEAAQQAEKADVTEEIVRFKSHCQQFCATVAGGKGARGKKLDFIIQEMLREINTVGSKSSLLPVAQHVIRVKDELEKLREQVQNVA